MMEDISGPVESGTVQKKRYVYFVSYIKMRFLARTPNIRNREVVLDHPIASINDIELAEASLPWDCNDETLPIIISFQLLRVENEE